MARYVDGYVLPIPTKNIPAYRKLARQGARIWREHGALQYCEAVGEDLAPPGPFVSFARAMKRKPGETVVFAWIVFRSRAHRDRVNAAVMKDPRMNDPIMKESMPVDMKRFATAGFEVLVGW
jgi:uncharacterized protein YbaA (DUF1428 family)